MRPVRAWDETASQSPEGAEGTLSPVRAEFQEGVWRRNAAEVLGVARCPCCHTELVARMGRSGPYFACRCPGGRVGRRARR
jgi:hypothetical protein